jgi:hypothetical protein
MTPFPQPHQPDLVTRFTRAQQVLQLAPIRELTPEAEQQRARMAKMFDRIFFAHGEPMCPELSVVGQKGIDTPRSVAIGRWTLTDMLNDAETLNAQAGYREPKDPGPTLH